MRELLPLQRFTLHLHDPNIGRIRGVFAYDRDCRTIARARETLPGAIQERGIAAP